MFKLLYTTDVHLNFCHEQKIRSFCDKLVAKEPDAIVITGDIAEAPSVEGYLTHVNDLIAAQCPVFFVLGNHDYYHGSIEYVRSLMKEKFTYPEEYKNNLVPTLGWLGSSGVIPLTEKSALVGHDGWYDGGYANWFRSRVDLNDYYLISELGPACVDRNMRFNKINELSKHSAEYVHEQLVNAFEIFEHAYVATHVPPFRENATYNGKISDNNWMPHFSSKYMGDMLKIVAEKYKDKKITVLCGHSHGFADKQISNNLRCITGKARYKNPIVNDVFEIE